MSKDSAGLSWVPSKPRFVEVNEFVATVISESKERADFVVVRGGAWLVKQNSSFELALFGNLGDTRSSLYANDLFVLPEGLCPDRWRDEGEDGAAMTSVPSSSSGVFGRAQASRNL